VHRGQESKTVVEKKEAGNGVVYNNSVNSKIRSEGSFLRLIEHSTIAAEPTQASCPTSAFNELVALIDAFKSIDFNSLFNFTKSFETISKLAHVVHPNNEIASTPYSLSPETNTS